MKKCIISIVAFLAFCFFNISQVQAFEETTAGTSAGLYKRIDVEVNKKENTVFIENEKINRLTSFLKRYNSSLSLYSKLIVEQARDYGIPWSLIVAISGVESTFCRFIPTGSSNCWGWNNGSYHFKDLSDGIKIVSRSLKINYFDKGRTTPETIAPIYAPPSSSWSRKVRFFMNLIENYTPSNTTTLSINL